MYCIECFQYARPAELDVSVRRRAIMAVRKSVVKYLECRHRFSIPDLSRRNKKEVRAHRQADADHERPHLSGVGLLRVTRAEPPSQQSTRDHYSALWPQNGSREDDSH